MPTYRLSRCAPDLLQGTAGSHGTIRTLPCALDPGKLEDVSCEGGVIVAWGENRHLRSFEMKLQPRLKSGR